MISLTSSLSESDTYPCYLHLSDRRTVVFFFSRGRVITAAYAALTTMPEATAADDAAAAQWWPLNALPKLAFDHETILRDAKRVMNIKD